MSVVLDCFGLTDRGRVRKNNEDQFLIATLAKRMRVSQTTLPDDAASSWHDGQTGHLFVVADGMGGLAGGEIASGLAVETVSWYVNRMMPWFHRFQEGREEELENELRVAVEACQRTVSDAAGASRYRHMGTTLTMAYLLWPRLYVVHAGDSRCYLIRGDDIHQMTKDHTVAQRVVDEGVMTAAQAEKAGLGHTLWKCIGGGGEGVNPDVYRATLEPGDGVLLCSDGLTRRLDDRTILALWKTSATPESAAKAMVAAANEAGGDDNITVIAARSRVEHAPNATPVDGTAFLPPL